jgi:heptosyltransferase-2
MALPAVRALRRHFAGAAIAVAGPASVMPLFAEDTGLDGIGTIVLPVDRCAQVRALREGGFGTAVLFTNSFGSAWVVRSAGVPQRWGFGTAWRRMLLTRAVQTPGGRLHQSDYYRELAVRLGAARDDNPPAIAVTETTMMRARERLVTAGWDPAQPLVGFAPGAAYGHAKRWPPAEVAEVVARLADQRGAASVLVGSAGDRPAARAIESSLAGRRVIDLVGHTDLRTATGVLAHCRAVVTNDSGAMHLAAAIGLPVTAVFGPTDERVTGPAGSHAVLTAPVFCRPCRLRECPIDHRCMKRISADMVFDAVSRQLSQGPEHAA